MTLSERIALHQSTVDSARDIPTYSVLRPHPFHTGTGDYCARCGGTRLAVFGHIGDRRTRWNAVHPDLMPDVAYRVAY